MALTVPELRAVGLALYGHNWQAPLARALGVNPRTIRKLAAGEFAVSDTLEADIRRLTGTPDTAARLFPRDEWIVGDGATLPGGNRRGYVVHTKAPRFVARVHIPEDGGESDADTLSGVVYSTEEFLLCEFAWIDPPPPPDQLTRLLRAACDAIEEAAG